MQAHITSPVD